jgi:ParB-like chromosome segregation protein Spo0J
MMVARTRHHGPPVRSAFEASARHIALAEIVPLRAITPAVRRSAKYAQIATSIGEVGIIEPLVVARSPGTAGKFLLLDGHLRLDVIREAGASQALCLLATDDEAFTYNKRISRLAAVQEHRMILQAVERSVPEERLAKALNIDISTLREKKRALDGICPEAVAILSDKPIPLSVFRVLRRMMPLRQIEAAEMMVGMNRYTRSYAETMLAATSQAQLVPDAKAKVVKGLGAEQLALMQRETTQLDREIKVAQQSFGADHLRLVLARAYLRKLIANVRVNRYLAQHQPEMLAEFRKVVEAEAVAA